MESIFTSFNLHHSALQGNLFFSRILIKILLLFTLLILTGFFQIHGQNYEWIRTGQGFNNQCGKGICTDSSGNCFVTGTFKNEYKTDSFSFKSKGQEDIFLAKYSSVGKLEWIHQLGSSDYDFGKSVVCDKSGNVYLTGYFGDTLISGENKVITEGNSDVFIAKYSGYGDQIWIKHFGGKGFDFGKDITLDKEENIYLTGTFQDTIRIENKVIISYGSSDIFIAKFDKEANLLWFSVCGGKKFDYGNGIVIDSSGNCISTGFFQDTAIFNDTILTSRGSYDIFISKYNSEGKLEWVKQAGGTGHDEAHGIGIDNEENYYITGYFDANCYFGNTMLKVFNKDVDDFFIAKYNLNGELQWAKGAGDFTNDIAYDIYTDSSGNSFITGVFYGTLNLGGITLKSVGSDDCFIIKYDKQGSVIWATQIGGSEKSYGFGVIADDAGTVFSTGYFSGTEKGGQHSIISTDKYDMFITKIIK